MAGVDLVHVPYKGGGPALAAVVAGEVQMTFANVSVALPQIRAGKLKALAVTSLRRKDALPSLPSLDEIGLKGFDVTSWVGVTAPVRVAPDRIRKLNRDIHTVLSDPEMRRELEARALEPLASTPEALGKHIAVEIERWSRVVRDAGVHIQG
jgi:tripartite-type tricarboxylate transporter receptor subunit TctC